MRKRTSLPALILVLCLLLQLAGCTKSNTKKKPASDTVPQTVATQAPVETEPVETDPPAEDPTEPDDRPHSGDPSVERGDEALIRWQNAGYRDYLEDAPIEMVPFSEMEYRRPDLETMYSDFDALIARAETETDADALLSDYYKVYDRYIDFYTMDHLAEVRYSINTLDSFYREEYDYCEAETPTVEEKLEALYKAFAASPCRDELERRYFEEGFFLKYDDYEVFTNETYLALSQKEEALMNEYRTLTEDPMIEFEGEQQSFWELMDSASGLRYLRVLRAYYAQYNPKIGEIYLELVKVRRQLAETLEYDSYADYSYDFTYHRDYTPQQGDDFIAGVEEYLVPVYQALMNSGYDPYSSGSSGRISEEKVRAFVKSAAEQIGGTVADAYRFMETYELSDITKAEEKKDTSYQIYLFGYEAPFVMVNSTGTREDYTTFAHEFGHFTDSFFNYGANEDLETAETFSQAMEFLALIYSKEIRDSVRISMLNAKTVDILMTFISQAAYAKFESLVYALPEEELTVEAVNKIYRQICKDFGFYDATADFYYSESWIDIPHFFEAPYYVISYCVSADTALQVYQRETANPGDGVTTYFDLLNREYEAGIQQVAEAAGLDNPFREESFRELADFFREKLQLEA